MPWTDYQKAAFATQLITFPLYVAGHIAAPGSGGADELVGHGYSRGMIPVAILSVSGAGIISLSADIEIYTPSDDAAQDITHLSYWDALDVGNMLIYSDIAIDDIEVPAMDRPVNLLAGTIINT